MAKDQPLQECTQLNVLKKPKICYIWREHTNHFITIAVNYFRKLVLTTGTDKGVSDIKIVQESGDTFAFLLLWMNYCCYCYSLILYTNIYLSMSPLSPIATLTALAVKFSTTKKHCKLLYR